MCAISVTNPDVVFIKVAYFVGVGECACKCACMCILEVMHMCHA